MNNLTLEELLKQLDFVGLCKEKAILRGSAEHAEFFRKAEEILAERVIELTNKPRG